MSAAPVLRLAHGLAFEDLYRREGLERIDNAFSRSLQVADSALHAKWLEGRANPGALEYKAEAELLIALGPCLDSFLAKRPPDYEALRSRLAPPVTEPEATTTVPTTDAGADHEHPIPHPGPCPFCGRGPLAPDAVYCGYCGKPLWGA